MPLGPPGPPGGKPLAIGPGPKSPCGTVNEKRSQTVGKRILEEWHAFSLRRGQLTLEDQPSRATRSV